MRYEPFDWYAAPAYYDIVFDPLAAEEVDFVASAFALYGKRRPGTPRALEPACGSGRVLAGLVERGWSVTGFDVSEGMVAHARKRLPHARITQQEMQSFRVRGRFDLVFNLVSTFKYLESDEDALAHLSLVADVLHPGGVFLLGLHLSDYTQTSLTRERWTGTRGGTDVVCNVQRWPPKRRSRTEAARARLVVSRRGERRGYESIWTFRTYSERELMRLLAREPRLSHVASYGFDFDIHAPVEDDQRLDRVLVLRKNGPPPAD